MLLSNVFMILVLILQRNAICNTKKFHSPLAKICHNKSESMCLGVQVESQWLLANNLCKHLSDKNTKVIMGSLHRNCTKGKFKKVSKTYELKGLKNLVLLKLTSPFEGEHISFGSVSGNTTMIANCGIYCLQAKNGICGDKIKPIQTMDMPCTDEINPKGKICLKSDKEHTFQDFDGSPMLCNKAIIGYVSSMASQNFLTLTNVSKLRNEIDNVIKMDAEIKPAALQAITSSLLKICRDEPNDLNVCLGINIKPQWLFGNATCKHIYNIGERIRIAHISKDCKTGQQNVISETSIKDEHGIALIKVAKSIELNKQVELVNMKEQHEKLKDCVAYHENNKTTGIELHPIVLLPCSSIYNDTKEIIKDKICVLRENDSVPYTKGSLVLCDKKIVGYMLSIGVRKDIETVVLLNDSLKEIENRVSILGSKDTPPKEDGKSKNSEYYDNDYSKLTYLSEVDYYSDNYDYYLDSNNNNKGNNNRNSGDYGTNNTDYYGEFNYRDLGRNKDSNNDDERGLRIGENNSDDGASYSYNDDYVQNEYAAGGDGYY